MKLGHENGHAVARLQQWLGMLGYAIAVDGQFGPNTEKALKLWQAKSGLQGDGIFGPASFKEMRSQVLDELIPANHKHHTTLRQPADVHSEGSAAFTILRVDVALQYRKLYDACKARGIALTSAGGLRALASSVGEGRSATSLHYAGLAFDMATNTGCYDPEKDVFVIEPLANRRWRVWARVLDEKAPLAPTHEITIENPATYWKRTGNGESVSGKFVDFTDLASQFGFCGIPAHSDYLKKGASSMKLEWWHFQLETVLMPYFSTFGQEVMTIHSEATFNKYPLHVYRDLVWKKNWHG